MSILPTEEEEGNRGGRWLGEPERRIMRRGLPNDRWRLQCLEDRLGETPKPAGGTPTLPETARL